MDQLLLLLLFMKISLHIKLESINTLLEVLSEDTLLKLLDMEMKTELIIGL